jgi:uncharacterized protein
MSAATTQYEAVGTSRDRVVVIDALRGFALFGVIVANVVANLGFNPSFNPTLLAAPRDRTAFNVLELFVSGRFAMMFSLLFGIGFGLMASRMAARETSFVHVYLRRTAILFLIGFAHLVLTGGDILIQYSILALVLLAMRNLPTRAIVAVAVASLFLPAIGRTLVDALGIQRGVGASPAVIRDLSVNGSYLELVGIRLAYVPKYWWVVMNSTGLLSVFLLGLLIARYRVLERLEENRRLFATVLVLATPLVVASLAFGPVIQSWASTFSRPWSYFINPLIGLRGVLQTLAYVSAFLLLWNRVRVRRVLEKLVPAGRLALTNYLLGDIVATIGVLVTGTFNSVGPAVGCALGVVLWIALILGSRWWIDHFRMGPAEWAWRSLTYGKRLALRYLEASIAAVKPIGSN